jgi:hypothetical protein
MPSALRYRTGAPYRIKFHFIQSAVVSDAAGLPKDSVRSPLPPSYGRARVTFVAMSESCAARVVGLTFGLIFIAVLILNALH